MVRMLLAAAVFLPIYAHGTQIVEASDGATVYVKASKREITRIALDHGRIAKLRFRAGELNTDQDDETGQLFVMVPEGVDRPVNAFLTTTTGSTFTLLLQPVDMPGDSVILRQPANQLRENPPAPTDPYVRSQQRLLTALAADTVPRGVDLREVSAPYLLWKNVHMTLQRLLIASALVGERYTITNQGQAQVLLEEREFWRPGVNAIGIDRLTLAPGDSTALYVVRERKNDD